MTWPSILCALVGGAMIGLASSVALLANGRVAGISGTLAQAFHADGGRGFRLPFLAGLVATGAIATLVMPSAFGAPLRPTWQLAIAGGLVGVGTALGKGCTSGHGVCGLSRVSKRSLVAVMTFMLTAGITVAIAGSHA